MLQRFSRKTIELPTQKKALQDNQNANIEYREQKSINQESKGREREATDEVKAAEATREPH